MVSFKNFNKNDLIGLILLLVSLIFAILFTFFGWLAYDSHLTEVNYAIETFGVYKIDITYLYDVHLRYDIYSGVCLTSFLCLLPCFSIGLYYSFFKKEVVKNG